MRLGPAKRHSIFEMSSHFEQMWCWAAYNDTWRDVWEVCRAGNLEGGGLSGDRSETFLLVNQSNFGLCLDTFQIT